ncbi:MAG: hypothetical protein JSV84_05675 [Gemmatimonadota bacterium]|nr:MAG: hypothetical protein JSV84_05675 [Gemmatimonadota bacterium]
MSTVQNWVNRHGVTYTVVYDSTGHVCERFGGGWPVFIIVDRFMQFQDFKFFYPDQFDESYMRSQIDRYLAKKIRMIQVMLDDSQGNSDAILNCGETAHLFVELENACIEPSLSNLRGSLESEDTHIILEKDETLFNTIPGHGSGNNSHDPFIIGLDLASGPHYASLELVIDTEPSHKDTFTFRLPVGNPDILLIDDNGGMSYEQYYERCLFHADKVHHEWDMRSQDIQSLDLSEYEILIWFTGDEQDSTLTAKEQDLLTEYLDGGGHLIISGQNIGFDLVTHGSMDDSLFHVNYLHADYVSDSIEESFLCGIQGDPITADFPFLPIDENQSSLSVITPREGASPILVYHMCRETAAIKYEGNHKVVYLALGFEGIRTMSGDDDEFRGIFMNKIIQWLRYVPTKGDVNGDDAINILDVIQTVNIILGISDPTDTESWTADCNDDGMVNVFDALGIVNVILGIGTCLP